MFRDGVGAAASIMVSHRSLFRDRNDKVCHAAGTNHVVSIDKLKKATLVIRAQRQKRRRDEQQSQMPDAGNTGDDVLDID